MPEKGEKVRIQSRKEINWKSLITTDNKDEHS